MSEEVERLFELALEHPTAERDEFLIGACGHDRELLESIRALLESDREASTDPFWSGSAIEAEAKQAASATHALIGRFIGPYRVTGIAGTGGMGAVYRAVRDDSEYRQTVAIKIVRRGIDSEAGIARFRRERQILAQLEHPNIARLLDGGTTKEGLPYLVMEFIEGEPLTHYCETRGLDTAARLRLFCEACAAVAFAHQRLVVHRDLKPGNILVGADGHPKLLDFGIARLLDEDPDSEPALAVTIGAGILTPGYASPEQVRGEAVTTASDVYSLGVILYELLAGTSPYKKGAAAGVNVLRQVCEEEPERPSTAARQRTGEGAQGALPFRSLRGDLDNIVMMALRKEPERRYPSVEQLAADIRLHLEGRPVAARGNSYRYVAGTFVRRHRLALSAATVLIATLIAGIVLTTRAEQRAERRFEQVRKLAHAVLFEYHDAIENLPGSTAVRRKMVADALQYLDSLSREEPSDSLRLEMAQAYVKISNVLGNSNDSNLGDTAGALASARKAVALAEPLAARSRTPENLSALAAAYRVEAELLHGTNDLAHAAQRYRQAVALAEELVRRRPRDSAALLLLEGALRHYAELLGGDGIANLGRTGEALAMFRRALDIDRELVEEHPELRLARKELAISDMEIADSERAAGHRAAAETGLRQALDLMEQAAAADPANTNTRLEVAGAALRLCRQLADDGSPREGLPYCMQTLAAMESLAAIDPSSALYRRDVSVTETHVCNTMRRAGDIRGAIGHCRRALDIAQQLSAADPASSEMLSDVANSHRRLGDVLLDDGNPTAALAEQRAAMGILRSLTAGSKDANLLGGLARATIGAGDDEMALHRAGDALPYYRLAVETAEPLANGDPTLASARSDLARGQTRLADCLDRAGRDREARAVYGRAADNWHLLARMSPLTREESEMASRAEARGRGR